MTPTDNDRQAVRVNTDEVIPPGGVAEDTMFSVADVDAFLAASDSVEEATWRAWRAKALRVVDPNRLAEVTIGSEKLKFQDPAKLRDIALAEADYWHSRIPSGTVIGSQVFSAGPAYLPGITTDWDGNTLPSAPYPGNLSRLLP